LQNKRKEKLLQLQNQQQQQQQQQQQEQKAPLFANMGRRKSDSDNEASGFATLDAQKQNNTANHHEQIIVAGIPLQPLQDIP
jgi:hypothetical protein